jgi:hypothetical protein
MTNRPHNAVAAHRKRLKDRGLARIEVQIPAEDADLMRRTAQLLRGESAAKLRMQLRRLIAAQPAPGLKELLAGAPLEDIDLTRDVNSGRSVEL